MLSILIRGHGKSEKMFWTWATPGAKALALTFAQVDSPFSEIRPAP